MKATEIRYRLTKTGALVLALWTVCFGQAVSSELQTHESIREAARNHVLGDIRNSDGKITATASQLDRRLKLAACSQPLKTFLPNGRKNESRWTVGVRCSGKREWTLYVSVTVSTLKHVLIANRELLKGTIITASDLKTEERDIARLHRGYLERAEQAVGKELKRTLHEGDVVAPTRIVSPDTIKRGSQVTILASVGSIRVRMNGKALGKGAIGERIKVLNESSRRKIEATIIAPGIVEVAM